MTIVKNSFEGGTNGSAVGTSSAGGDAFTASDAAIVFSNAVAAHGSLSAQVTGSGNVQMRYAIASPTTEKTVGYFYVTAAQTADTDLFRTTITGDSTNSTTVRLNAANKLRLALPGSVFPWTATNSFPLNQWVRVERWVDSGTSSTTGSARIAYFIGDSTTATEDSGLLTGLSTGSGSAFVNVRIGKTNSAALSAGALYIDDVAVYTGSDAVSTATNPYVAPSTPPTIAAGGSQTISSPGSAVNITCTATPASGSTIASYQWVATSWPVGSSAPAITNATSQTASFTPTVRGRYIFSVTAKDNNNLTSAAATTKVFVPDTVIKVIEVTSNTGWTVGSVADLSDGSDSTYIESGAPGGNSVIVLRLNPITWPPTGFPLDMRSAVGSAGGTQRVELLEGSNVRKNWGGIGPSTAQADLILNLTSGEIATIGSGNELDLRLTQV